jgi:tripeptidyl-peptidase I
VTSVGATILQDDGSEVTAMTSSWASSGGISWYFTAPDYQASALATYFVGHDPTHADGCFNRSGRGFPDVAAVGENMAVAVAGQLDLSGGTSAATPLVGALLNRVNEERLAAGKTPTFNDVVSGNNSMCGGGLLRR